MSIHRRLAATLSLLIPLLLVLGATHVAPAAAAPPHINHLFIIVLENEDADETFGANPPSPYLGATLKSAGAYIPNYFGIGHASLDNYLAMISGQPPNPVTQADCSTFSEMTPGTLSSAGIALGQGCVYPDKVQTVVNQLEASKHSWRAYMQDMANAGQPATCRHPVIGGHDEAFFARTDDQYATRHDPFVYFHSIIDHPTCQKNVVDLGRLPKDLRKDASTPEYVFITPDVCADGHDATCADGSPGGFAGIDAFLREWVPRIEGSAAYQDRGALLVTFDESESSAEACCNETSGPNTTNNGGGIHGDGGGQIGAVMSSPCVKPGTVAPAPYNHYSMLRWVEDNFGLSHLAEAAANGLRPFGADVFNRPDCQLGTQLKVRPKHAVAGRKTAFKFQLVTKLPACQKGAVVNFAGGQAKTDSAGQATIEVKPRRGGPSVATVTSPICDPAKARVQVLAARP